MFSCILASSSSTSTESVWEEIWLENTPGKILPTSVVFVLDTHTRAKWEVLETYKFDGMSQDEL